MERTRKKEERKGGKEGKRGGREDWRGQEKSMLVLETASAWVPRCRHDSSDLIYFATKFIFLAGLSSGHLQKWE